MAHRDLRLGHGHSPGLHCSWGEDLHLRTGPGVQGPPHVGRRAGGAVGRPGARAEMRGSGLRHGIAAQYPPPLVPSLFVARLAEAGQERGQQASGHPLVFRNALVKCSLSLTLCPKPHTPRAASAPPLSVRGPITAISGYVSIRQFICRSWAGDIAFCPIHSWLGTVATWGGGG